MAHSSLVQCFGILLQVVVGHVRHLARFVNACAGTTAHARFAYFDLDELVSVLLVDVLEVLHVVLEGLELRL